MIEFWRVVIFCSVFYFFLSSRRRHTRWTGEWSSDVCSSDLEKRVEGYRNFATKLWNAARFLQMNGVGASDSIAAPPAELPVNRWIIGEVVETLGKLDQIGRASCREGGKRTGVEAALEVRGTE